MLLKKKTGASRGNLQANPNEREPSMATINAPYDNCKNQRKKSQQ